MVHRIIKKAIYKGNTVEYWLRFMSSHLLDIHSVMK